MCVFVSLCSRHPHRNLILNQSKVKGVELTRTQLARGKEEAHIRYDDITFIILFLTFRSLNFTVARRRNRFVHMLFLSLCVHTPRLCVVVVPFQYNVEEYCKEVSFFFFCFFAFYTRSWYCFLGKRYSIVTHKPTIHIIIRLVMWSEENALAHTYNQQQLKNRITTRCACLIWLCLFLERLNPHCLRETWKMLVLSQSETLVLCALI